MEYYAVAMRASEAHRQHNDVSKKLAAVIEEKRQRVSELMAEKPLPAGALHTATVELQAAQVAFDAHTKDQPDPVRDYRLVSFDGTQEFGRFRCHYSQAKSRANELIRELQIDEQPLEEQLLDGTWVDYHPSLREG